MFTYTRHPAQGEVHSRLQTPLWLFLFYSLHLFYMIWHKPQWMKNALLFRMIFSHITVPISQLSIYNQQQK